TRNNAAALLPGLKEKAADARRRGATEEVNALQARVRKWGQSDLLSDFESVLADAPATAVPPPASPPAAAVPKEVEAYHARWEAAFARAASGDPATAVQDLAAATQGLADASLRSESTEDLEALRRVAAAVQEIRDAVAR